MLAIEGKTLKTVAKPVYTVRVVQMVRWEKGKQDPLGVANYTVHCKGLIVTECERARSTLPATPVFSLFMRET